MRRLLIAAILVCAPSSLWAAPILHVSLTIPDAEVFQNEIVRLRLEIAVDAASAEGFDGRYHGFGQTCRAPVAQCGNYALHQNPRPPRFQLAPGQSFAFEMGFYYSDSLAAVGPQTDWEVNIAIDDWSSGSRVPIRPNPEFLLSWNVIAGTGPDTRPRAVPEPGLLVLLAIGGIAAYRRLH